VHWRARNGSQLKVTSSIRPGFHNYGEQFAQIITRDVLIRPRPPDLITDGSASNTSCRLLNYAERHIKCLRPQAPWRPTLQLVADPSFGESAQAIVVQPLIKIPMNEDNEIPARLSRPNPMAYNSIIRAKSVKSLQQYTARHQYVPAPSHVQRRPVLLANRAEFARLNTSCTSAKTCWLHCKVPACKSTYSLPTIRSISTAARSLSNCSNEKWGVTPHRRFLAKSI